VSQTAGNSPTQLIARARRFILEDLWAHNLATLAPGRLLQTLIRMLQFSVFAGRGLVDDQLLLRASALTYMTSLALIPILVLLLSIIEWLGLSRNLATLAVDRLFAGSPGAVDKVMGVVDSANIGALGSVGGAVFLITTILSLRAVEQTFNEIWRVRVGRGWMQRFTNYLAVLVVVPLLLGTGISLATTLRSDVVVEVLSNPLVSGLSDGVFAATPTFFMFIGFTSLYWLLPNTPVRLSSALVGGLLAAIGFTAAQDVYVNFSVGVARYNALFGSFAFLPLLLAWIYLSWAIVLMGCEVTYAHQHLERYRREALDRDLPQAEREALGLRMALGIARVFRDRAPPQSAVEIADALDIAIGTVGDLLERFEGVGIVSPCGREDEEDRFQLGRPAEEITVSEVIAAVRGTRVSNRRAAVEMQQRLGATERVADDVLSEMESRSEAIGARTLSELLADVPAAAAASTA
jgi:membrane protein